MSAAAVKWAFSKTLPATERFVLVELARAYSPRWGHSKPSQAKLAKDAGLARQTVNRVLRSLEKKGLIEAGVQQRKKGKWDRKFYKLAPKEGGIPAPKKRADRVTQGDTAPCHSNLTRNRVTLGDTSLKKDSSHQDSAFALLERSMRNAVHDFEVAPKDLVQEIDTPDGSSS